MDYVEGGAGISTGGKIGITIAVIVVILICLLVGLYFGGYLTPDAGSDSSSNSNSNSSTGTGSGGSAYTPKNYTQWACYDGIYVPIKQTASGDPACLSRDGMNCVWSTDDAGCKATLANMGSPVNQLACGADVKSKWGITGYEDPNHWCAKGKKAMM